jgi:hypothetical protein
MGPVKIKPGVGSREDFAFLNAYAAAIASRLPLLRVIPNRAHQQNIFSYISVTYTASH